MTDAAHKPNLQEGPAGWKCLNCGARARLSTDAVVCSNCQTEWPVREGIPRFFQPKGYWGEVGRTEATCLLRAARQGAWKEVVLSRFTDPNMLNGLLNLQRASWLPLLGLDSDAVVLDIGSGYGAITHSLALSSGHVYSIEAIPERIEFTQERLRQENITNVTLVQASALELPFFENSFDLAVVNGVLEWTGEWDLTDNPRAIQMKFLSSVRSLLKPDGVLVVGIENRFGYGLFLGGQDHSGMPFTSLVPRRVASFILKHSSRPHHRTVLNARREYRTYTYSARGYGKLLRDAGFPSATIYWANPGYNEPSRLIPIEAKSWVRNHFVEALDHLPSPGSSSLRRHIKKAFAATGLLHWVVPDFLIVVPKNPGRITRLDKWLGDVLGRQILREGVRAGAFGSSIFLVHTHPGSDKSVLWPWKPEAAREQFVIKANARAARLRRENVRTEFANLAQVREVLRQQQVQTVRTPVPLSEIQLGPACYVAESWARGTQLARRVRQPGYVANMQAVQRDFAQATAAAIELSRALQGLTEVAAIDASWYEVPDEIKAEPELARRLSSARYGSLSSREFRPWWIQHGDFTIENVFLDRDGKTVEIIDWGELASGLPPLYDIFTLILSSGLLGPSHGGIAFSTEEERWQASFSDLFLSREGLSSVFRQLLAQACAQLDVNPAVLPALLLEFLLIRVHYYRSQAESVMARMHATLLRDCLCHEDLAAALSPSPRSRTHQ